MVVAAAAAAAAAAVAAAERPDLCEEGRRRPQGSSVSFRSSDRFARVSPEYLRRDAPVFKKRHTNNRSDRNNIINNVVNRNR
jgi:hypothetical protein